MSCWEILGIASTSNVREIKRAYARLIAMYHPEEHPEKFSAIQTAYNQALQYAKREAQELIQSNGTIDQQRSINSRILEVKSLKKSKTVIIKNEKRLVKTEKEKLLQSYRIIQPQNIQSQKLIIKTLPPKKEERPQFSTQLHTKKIDFQKIEKSYIKQSGQVSKEVTLNKIDNVLCMFQDFYDALLNKTPAEYALKQLQVCFDKHNFYEVYDNHIFAQAFYDTLLEHIHLLDKNMINAFMLHMSIVHSALYDQVNVLLKQKQEYFNRKTIRKRIMIILIICAIIIVYVLLSIYGTNRKKEVIKQQQEQRDEMNDKINSTKDDIKQYTLENKDIIYQYLQDTYHKKYSSDEEPMYIGATTVTLECYNIDSPNERIQVTAMLDDTYKVTRILYVLPVISNE